MTMPDAQNGTTLKAPSDGQMLVEFNFDGEARHVYEAMRNMLACSAEFMMKSCDDASQTVIFVAYDGGGDLTAVVTNAENASTVTLYIADSGDHLAHKHAQRFHNDLTEQLQLSAQAAWNAPQQSATAPAMTPAATGTPANTVNGTAKKSSKPGIGAMILAWFAGLDRKGRATMAWIAAGVLFVLIFIGVISCGIASEHAPLPEGMSRMPESAATFEGQNYEDVVTQLMDAGFTNIETKAQEDLITGWMTKEGEVDKVSVAGKTDFSASEKFKSDVKIVVTYHAFPSDSSSSDDTSSDASSNEDASTSTDANDTSSQETPSQTDTQSSESADSAQ